MFISAVISVKTKQYDTCAQPVLKKCSWFHDINIISNLVHKYDGFIKGQTDKPSSMALGMEWGIGHSQLKGRFQI